MSSCIIIGAGPAGLTAAYELSRLGHGVRVLEKDDQVGGLARTHCYAGFRFDIGGHRFFTKVEVVDTLWRRLLGPDLVERSRLSRIYYDGKFFDYPLKPLNALSGLGPLESFRIGASFLKATLSPIREERTFEDWATNRFGRRLYEIFFKSYTEKVWGIPCSEIGADWAAQRIKNLNLAKAVINALIGETARSRKDVVTSLIERFHYPRLGPGQMWERCAEVVIDAGGSIALSTGVEQIQYDGQRITRVIARDLDAKQYDFEPDHVISSMPIRELVQKLAPPPPDAVLQAADALKYRDFLTVGLVVDRPALFPDNWIYVHSEQVKLGRIQNYKNWSPEMVPDATKTGLGLEYFLCEGDELWCMSDEALIELGGRECELLGLLARSDILDGTVIRTPKAYPVYDRDYQDNLRVVRSFLDQFSNLQLIGRNGQHRYNNQDHSMLSGIYAARNVMKPNSHDVWSINVEQSYHEESQSKSTSGDRLSPGVVPEQTLEELVRDAFARYDPVALGVATGTVFGFGLFLATVVLLLRGGDIIGPTLSLLGNYFIGYTVTWSGAWVGLAEGAVAGFVFGWILARLLNMAINFEKRALERRIEMARTLELIVGDDES